MTSYQSESPVPQGASFDSIEEPFLTSKVSSSKSNVSFINSNLGEDDDDDLSPAMTQFEKIKQLLMSPSSLILIALVFVGTLNRVYFRLMLVAANYPFFLNMWTSFVYMPVFFIVIQIIDRTSKEITPEMRAFPKRRFLAMGFLDAFSGLLITIGGVHTPGPLQTLLLQAAIPITMALALRFIPGTKYTLGQYAGASIILGGIIVALWPSISSPQTGSGGTHSPTLTGELMFMLGNIPMALSSIYKERTFKDQPMSVYYLNFWVAVFQFSFSTLFLPITAIPAFGGVAFKNMPSSIANGAKCLVGINSRPTDTCGHAWIPICLYTFFNIFYNISLLLVLQRMSAAIFYIVSAIMLPLANISFTFKWLVGSEAKPLDVFDIIGLVFILFGLILYRTTAPKHPEDDEEIIDDTGRRLSRSVSVPILSLTGPAEVSTVVSTPRRRIGSTVISRDGSQIRRDYYQRLGLLQSNPGTPKSST